MKPQLRPLSLALSLLCASSAMAANYFVVVPVKGRTSTAPVETISVVLNAYTLPGALEGSVYSFDLKPLLTVTGDSAYTGTGVTWSVVSSSLPAGLSLTAAGAISGTPTATGTGAITVRASYKTQNGEQTYQVVVNNPIRTIVQYAGYRAWSDGTVAQSCNEYHQGKAGYAYIGATGDGVYHIQPTGETTPSSVYCDMTTNGGGYTVVASVNGLGASTSTWGQASAGNPPTPIQGAATYLPAVFAQRLASVSSGILIKQANSSNMLYSTDSGVMSNLRAGKIANYSDAPLDQTSAWTLSSSGLTQLNTKCAANDTSAGSTTAARYPSAFWGCGNTSALHVTRNITATSGVAGFTNTGGLQMVVMYR